MDTGHGGVVPAPHPGGGTTSRHDAFLRRCFGFLCTATLAACADQGPEVAPDDEDDGSVVASMVVRPDRVGLAVPGDTATLVAVVYNRWGYPIPGASITWSSADTTVATVDAAGRVRARSLGRASVYGGADAVLGAVPVDVDPAHSVARNSTPCHLDLPG